MFKQQLNNHNIQHQLQMLRPISPLQFKGAADVEHIHQAASRGVQGTSTALPHKEAIQHSFGKHDIGGVKAHVGGEATKANEQMGSLAYATGNNVAFKSNPDVHTTAHEVAHVIQQRSGVSLKGGVGQVGDRYEQHADAVADRVVQGKSAENLLDSFAGKPTPSSDAVQHRRDTVQFLEQPNYQDDWEIEDLRADAEMTMAPFEVVFKMLERAAPISRDLKTGQPAKIPAMKKAKYKATHPEVLAGHKSEGDSVYSPDAKFDKDHNLIKGRHILESKKVPSSGMGGLKGAKRIKQKTETKYANKARPIANINDVVRGTLCFDNCKDLLEALKIIQALQDPAFFKKCCLDYATVNNGFKEILIQGAEKSLQWPRYTIRRIKQLYEPNGALLYGDIKLNLEVPNAAGSHNCELQLNIKSMLEGKGTKAGHGAYEAFRNLDDECWQTEDHELPPKLKDYPEHFKKRAMGPVHQSQHAYRKADIALRHDPHYYPMIKQCEAMGAAPPDELIKTSGKKTVANPDREYYDRNMAAAKLRFDAHQRRRPR